MATKKSETDDTTADAKKSEPGAPPTAAAPAANIDNALAGLDAAAPPEGAPMSTKKSETDDTTADASKKSEPSAPPPAAAAPAANIDNALAGLDALPIFDEAASAKVADTLAAQAKGAGANVPVQNAIRTATAQFVARVQAMVKGNVTEPSVGSAPPLSPEERAVAIPEARVPFDPIAKGETFSHAETVELANGLVIGFRANAVGRIAMIARKPIEGVHPGETFGEVPRVAYDLVSNGLADLLDRKSLKVITPPRQ
jgi:hypothetical protein